MTPGPPRPILAAGLMVCATVLIAATTLMAKALGTDALGPALPVVQVTFGRFLFGAIAILSVAAVLRPRFNRANAPLHLMRVIFGWSGVTCMFAASAMIPLAEATAISFLNPIFAMLLAIPILGERVGPWRWLAAFISLIGALVLLRPGDGVISPGALFALGAAILLASEILVIKRLTRNESLLATLVWANSLGLIISIAAATPGWQPPTSTQWAVMAALGFTMAGAQGFFVNAMARADASYVTPFSYLTLVFAGLYDAVLFGVIPDPIGWLGAAIILGGAALLAWREGRLRP